LDDIALVTCHSIGLGSETYCKFLFQPHLCKTSYSTLKHTTEIEILTISARNNNSHTDDNLWVDSQL